MDRTPPPIALAAALFLPTTGGRRTVEVFRDGDPEVRMAASPSRGPQTPHERDELHVVAAGSGHYRVDGVLTKIGVGDLLFAAARAEHGFEDCSDDFSVRVVFYGPVK